MREGLLRGGVPLATRRGDRLSDRLGSGLHLLLALLRLAELRAEDRQGRARDSERDTPRPAQEGHEPACGAPQDPDRSARCGCGCAEAAHDWGCVLRQRRGL